jgi:hypothetical protein
MKSRRKHLLKPILAVLILAALAGLLLLTRPDPGGGQVATQPRAAEQASAPRSAKGASQEARPDEPAHGPESVVRTREQLGAAGKAPRPAAGPARWDQPRSLRFSELKKIYRAYRRDRDFDRATVARLSGAAVQIKGAVMPIDPVPESGEMPRFWLANPIVVMAGCVFCLPPTMADLLYVHARGEPFEVDREKLYRTVVRKRLLGRLELGPVRTPGGVEYLFGLELKEVLD